MSGPPSFKTNRNEDDGKYNTYYLPKLGLALLLYITQTKIETVIK